MKLIIKNIKKKCIVALVIVLIPAHMQAWTFGGAFASCKSFVNNNSKAVAAIAGAVAVVTGVVLWKKISDRKAARALQAKEQKELQDKQQKELQAKEQKELQAKEQKEEPVIESVITVEHVDRIRSQVQTGKLIPQDQSSYGFKHSIENHIAHIAHINTIQEDSFMRDFKDLKDRSSGRLHELMEEKNEIEQGVSQISNQTTLEIIKQFDDQLKKIKQEVSTILDIFSEDYLINLDKTYTNNFCAHNMSIAPTQAYELLRIQSSASQPVCSAFIKAQCEACLDEAQSNEERLWQVRQAAWVFGYPNCNQLAQRAYDLYLVWSNAGKPAEWKAQVNELLNPADSELALLLMGELQHLSIQLADWQNAIIQRQRQDEKDAQEYVDLGVHSLDDLKNKYDQFKTQSTNELTQISRDLAQSNVYERTHLMKFKEYMHELEMIHNDIALLRSNPECQEEANKNKLNELFFNVTFEKERLEKLIETWSAKLEYPLRKSFSDKALERVQQLRQQLSNHMSQAGDLASSAKQNIKNKARTLLP